MARASILHLAPHYGGGVGAVVRALIARSQVDGVYRHRIACLEGLNSQMQAWAVAHGITHDAGLGLPEARAALDALIAEADIVQLHWWHHPLLNAWMHADAGPAYRCLLWSHVNGHFPPQNFPPGIADFPDLMVLASPWSLEAPALRATPPEGLRVIQSNAGVPLMPRRKVEVDGALRIGYVGTVDPAKMHPDFIDLCLNAGLDEATFVVAGGPREAALRTLVDTRAANVHFEILGPRQDVPELMAGFDIFGYPLNPWHYGTGEQVLIEAQAAGAVPVVLDTGCERWVVEDGRTGLVCAGPVEYSQALRHLARQHDWRQRLSRQAMESCTERFSIDTTVQAWHACYAEVLALPKRTHALSASSPASRPLEWLLAAARGSVAYSVYQAASQGATIPDESLSALPLGCFAATRGSPWHYRSFFSYDIELERLCRTLSSHSSPLAQENIS